MVYLIIKFKRSVGCVSILFRGYKMSSMSAFKCAVPGTQVYHLYLSSLKEYILVHEAHTNRVGCFVHLYTHITNYTVKSRYSVCKKYFRVKSDLVQITTVPHTCMCTHIHVINLWCTPQQVYTLTYVFMYMSTCVQVQFDIPRLGDTFKHVYMWWYLYQRGTHQNMCSTL